MTKQLSKHEVVVVQFEGDLDVKGGTVENAQILDRMSKQFATAEEAVAYEDGLSIALELITTGCYEYFVVNADNQTEYSLAKVEFPELIG